MSIPLGIIKSNNGATDYVGSGNTWHMDIMLDYKQIEDKYIDVIYKDGINGNVFANQKYTVLIGSKTPKFDLNLEEDGNQDPVRNGYMFKGWQPEWSEIVSKPVEGHQIVYTATWTDDKNNNNIDDAEESITVVYNDGLDGELFAPKSYSDLAPGTLTPVFEGSLDREDFVFYGWTPEVPLSLPTIEDLDGEEPVHVLEFTATWTDDKKGGIGTPENPTNPDDTPDGIPDAYQVRVEFNAINGRVIGNKVTYVTLLDMHGNYATSKDNGIGHLTEAQIPTTSANDGHHNGTWDIMPTTALDITEDTTFTITYVEIPEEETEEPNNRPDPVFQCPEGTVWNDSTGMCDAIVVHVPVDPGNNPPVGPVNPGVNVEDEVDIPEVDEEDTPEIIVDDEPEETPEIVEIEDEETPEAGDRRGHWALINLIATIGGALLALILLIGKHQKDADDEADENAQVVASEMDEEDEVVKRRRKWKFISTIVAVISVVIFFLTENMSLPMVLVDKYTMLMLALFLGNVVCLYMGKRWHEADEEEQERA